MTSIIEQLTVENLKRVKMVEISPDRSLVVIQGDNGNGKTSLLDAIWFALEGKRKADQPNPIREGEDSAKVLVDLGEIFVERTFKRKDGNDYTTKLRVTNKSDGSVRQSPQQVLDAMLSKLSFDPLAFLRMKPADQMTALRDLVPGFDFDKYERKRQSLFDERTQVNRDLKTKKAQVEAMQVPSEDALERVDVADLTDKINAIHERNRGRATVENEIKRHERNIEAGENQIADLEAQLKKVRETVQGLRDDMQSLGEPEPYEDPEPLIQKLRDAQKINAAADAVDAYKVAKANLEGYSDISDDLTEQIAKLDGEKSRAVAEAKLPVDGLSLADGYVELNGQPFDQASHAEQLRTSIAIAMSGDPDIRVLCVKDGSLLDDKSLEILQEQIKDTGWQVWLECVGKRTETGFTMVDGEVADG